MVLDTVEVRNSVQDCDCAKKLSLQLLREEGLTPRQVVF